MIIQINLYTFTIVIIGYITCSKQIVNSLFSYFINYLITNYIKNICS